MFTWKILELWSLDHMCLNWNHLTSVDSLNQRGTDILAQEWTIHWIKHSFAERSNNECRPSSERFTDSNADPLNKSGMKLDLKTANESYSWMDDSLIEHWFSQQDMSESSFSSLDSLSQTLIHWPREERSSTLTERFPESNTGLYRQMNHYETS